MSQTSTPQDLSSYVGKSVGPYTLLSLLGVGGMGAVFLARHERLEKQVAVKLMRSLYRDQPEAVRSFFGEAKAAATIGHENIVAVFDVDEDPGLGPYIAMELLRDAQSLADLLHTQPKLPIARVVRITRQIALGLGATHEKGIVHCDLKPSNVFLVRAHGQDDIVKLIDFGIARPSASPDLRASSALVLGTPRYMSPEQVSGYRMDGRSDQYALGILAYQMLTGRAPFEGAPGDVMRQQYKEAPPPMRPLRPDLPAPMEAVVLRALAKSPAARFPDIRDFGEALQQAAAGIEAALAKPSGPSAEELERFRGVLGAGGDTTGVLLPAETPRAQRPSAARSVHDLEGAKTPLAPSGARVATLPGLALTPFAPGPVLAKAAEKHAGEASPAAPLPAEKGALSAGVETSTAPAASAEKGTAADTGAGLAEAAEKRAASNADKSAEVLPSKEAAPSAQSAAAKGEKGAAQKPRPEGYKWETPPSAAGSGLWLGFFGVVASLALWAYLTGIFGGFSLPS